MQNLQSNLKSKQEASLLSLTYRLPSGCFSLLYNQFNLFLLLHLPFTDCKGLQTELRPYWVFSVMSAHQLISQKKSIRRVRNCKRQLIRPYKVSKLYQIAIGSLGRPLAFSQAKHRHRLLPAVACTWSTGQDTGDMGYFYFFSTFFPLLVQSSVSKQSGQSFQYFKLMARRNNVPHIKGECPDCQLLSSQSVH